MKQGKRLATISDWWFWGGSLALIIFSRWMLISQHLFHWDSIQFALALEQFDVTKHQPHPPGYVLYVGLGWLINQVTHNPNQAFIILNIIFSIIGFVIIVKFAQAIYGRTLAFLAGILYIINPAVWFHGLVAEVYIADAVIGLAVVYILYIYAKTQKWHLLLWAAVILGLLGGVRQITELVLLPLFGYLIWYNRKKISSKQLVTVVLTLAFSNLLWFVPLIALSGGLLRYFTAVRLLTAGVISAAYRESFWGTIGSNFKLMWLGITQGLPLLIPISVGAALPYFASESANRFKIDPKKFWFWFWSLLPSVIIAPLILVRNPGYVLLPILLLIILLTGSLQLIFKLISDWAPRWSRVIIGRLVVITLGFQAYTFFTLPPDSYLYYSASLKSVREVDKLLSNTFDIIHQQSDPDSSLVMILEDVMIPGVRQMQYYMPEYNVYAYMPYILMRSDPKSVFWHVRGSNVNEFSVQIPIASSIKSILLIGEGKESDIFRYATGIGTKDSYRLWKLDITDPVIREILKANKIFDLQ